MNVLALDTSSPACSVALSVAGELCERHVLRPREHTRLLLPMIGELLHDAGIAAADLDAVVLGNGPGSFIGMRIAAAVAQGLCFGSGARLAPVSSLAAIAVGARAEAGVERVLVAQDAHMNEVYLAGFEVGADALPTPARPLALHPAGPIADLAAGIYAAGAGWQRYDSLWDANRERLAGRLDILHPRASWVLALGMAALHSGQVVAPERLEPAYVRERVARPGVAATP